MPRFRFHGSGRAPRWRAWLLAGALLGGWSARGVTAPVRISFDAVIEPVAFVDEQGRPSGFAADYVRAIGNQAGLEFELVTGRKEDLQAQFQDGRIAAIAVLAYTEDRAKIMDFTLPYLALKGAVFERKDSGAIKSVADFSGRKIAVSRGNFTHNYLLAHPEWGAVLVLVDSTEAALRAVQAGQCDAAVNVDLVAQKIIRDQHLDRVVRSEAELPGLVYKYHLAVHKGDAELLRTINEAQLAVHENGTFAEIYEKWIGPLHSRGLVWRDLRPFVIPAALVALVIAWAFMAQRRTLRQLSLQAEALRHNEERLNLVLQSGRHSLWDWDVQKNHVVRGPMLAAALGYEPEEISPDPEGIARLLHPDESGVGKERVQEIFARPGKDEFSSEVRVRAKSGEWRWFATVGRVLARDPSGRALRAVGTHTDITQRKEAEEAVRRLNRDLEQRVAQRTAELAARVTEVELLNRELEAFSYSVSHDLRAPLRNITGFLELLVRRVGGRLDAESDRFVGTVTAEAKRLGTLIDDLLAFSRIGRAELALRRVELATVVDEVRQHLQPEIGARRIEWQVAALPAVQGDAALLRQVVANLVSNAVKFTRHRDPARIEIGVAPSDGNASVATFFVRDNGAGYNPKYAEKLFGVFQRLHNQRDFEGTGIGLANVKRIVERHGGRVWAEGKVDSGAVFYFNLKLAPP